MEISATENRKAVEKPSDFFFKKTNNTDKPLSRLTKKK